MLPKVLLFRAVSLFSKFIGWQTDSEYSHAALKFHDCIIESVEGYGVRKVPLSVIDWSRVVEFEVAGMDAEAAAKIREFAESEVGQGYDYWGALRFVSRRRLPTNEKWFCSELVFAALQAGGIELLERIDPQQVSPGMLSYSPFLVDGR